jgi:hypothetical protein
MVDSLTHQVFLEFRTIALNPDRRTLDICVTGFCPRMIGELDMSRAAHIFAPISAVTSSSEKSDTTLDPIVLFCGICLLAFLVAILTGEQGVWY